jgi:hypothetical protein
MKKLRRNLLDVFFALVIVYALGTIAFNFWLPLGVHVGIATQKSFSIASDWKGRLFDLLTWRPLSALIVKSNKKKCDMPFFIVEKKGESALQVNRFFSDGTRSQGSNLRLAHLITYRNDPNHNKDVIDKLLAESLSQCDPNGGTIAINDYSPLNSAIAKKELDVIEALLRRGVVTTVPLQHAGKPFDGMNSAQFARFLEAKAKTDDSRATYKKIAELIEKHDAKTVINR